MKTPGASFAFLTLWMLKQVRASGNSLIDLVPLPRDLWDNNYIITKRAEDYASSVSLNGKEQLMWTSHESTAQKQTVVSMVVYTKQDENIIDMDKFAFSLKSVTCSDKMVLTFKFKLAYLAAKISWNWVNFNNIRSFVLVTSWPGCGEKRNREPWVVSDAIFNDKADTITLNAVKSTWKKVSNTTVIDFGDFVPGKISGRDEPSEIDKRVLDVSLRRAFTLDLTSTFPEKIVSWNISTPRVKANLGINCDNCGTSGTLVFAGHIEASLFGGLEKFELSAKPTGVQANLNLEAAFEGEVDFRGVGAYKEEFTLLTLPLPSGWRIPGILTFGPNIQINAGFQIDYIGGSASVTTGISALIPDSSIAKVDLAAEKPVDIKGWLPEIVTRPLEIHAQLDAEVHVYTEVAVAVTLEVLDENGINVDIGLRIPDVTIEASAGYNEIEGVGFCPNDPNPWGLKIDATLGASLYLEGYTEVNGDKKVFLNVPLFESPALYTFPQLCLAFGTKSPGACIDIPEPEDPEYQDPSIPPLPIERRTDLVPRQPYSLIRRSDLVLRSQLSKRRAGSRNPYYLTCDKATKTTKLRAQHYPVPSQVKAATTDVPTMIPHIKCSDEECPINAWDITDNRNVPGGVNVEGWATEHVYEANWVVKYMDVIQKKYFTGAGNCVNVLNLFGTEFSDDKKIDTPDKSISDDNKIHEKAKNYTQALMQNIGTEYSYKSVMALLPDLQNRWKNLMFEGSHIDKKFKQAYREKGTYENTPKRLACQLGRLVTVCKYMNHPEIKLRLSKTIKALETVLDRMNLEVTKPTGLTSFKAEHKEWFVDFYAKGVENARARMREYATHLVGKNGFDDIGDEEEKAIKEMTTDAGSEKWCANDWMYPE